GRYVEIFIKNVTSGNGTEWHQASILTDNSGNFNVALSASFFGQYNVTAILNASVSLNSTHAYSFNLEINATSSLNAILFNSTLSSSFASIQIDETIVITGTLNIHGHSSLYQFSGLNVSAHIGGSTIGKATTDALGHFSISAPMPASASVGQDTITIMFNDTGFISGTTVQETVYIIDNNVANIAISCLINGQVQYHASYKESMTVSGTVTSGGQGVRYRTVRIYSSNGTEYFLGSTTTTSTGTFSLNLGTADYLGRWNITVELLLVHLKNSSHANPYNLEVNYTSTFDYLQLYEDDLNQYASLASSTYYFHVGWENVNITGRLTESGNLYHWSGKTVELWIDGNLTVSNSTDINGYFQFTYQPTASNASQGIPFSAMIRFVDSDPFINNYSFTFQVYFYNNPQLSLTSNNPSYYFQDIAIFSGTLVDADHPSVGIPGKQLSILANFTGYDTIIGNPITDQNGAFTLVHSISTPTSDLINVTVTYHGTSYSGNVQNLGVRPFDITPLIIALLVVLIIAVAAIIGSFVALKLYRRQQEIKAKLIDVAGNAQKIQALLDGGRINEAIIFLYSNFAHVCAGYLKLSRRVGRTNREFTEMVIRRVKKLNSKDARKLLELYEEARYSNHQLNRAKYDDAEKSHNRIVKAIMLLTPKDVIPEKEEEEKIIQVTPPQEQVARRELSVSE
ncbi:MAG: DUF4129 domain-containing protein, partial [Candidatus Helarchaeales archaeon]